MVGSFVFEMHPSFLHNWHARMLAKFSQSSSVANRKAALGLYPLSLYPQVRSLSIEEKTADERLRAPFGHADPLTVSHIRHQYTLTLKANVETGNSGPDLT